MGRVTRQMPMHNRQIPRDAEHGYRSTLQVSGGQHTERRTSAVYTAAPEETCQLNHAYLGPFLIAAKMTSRCFCGTGDVVGIAGKSFAHINGGPPLRIRDLARPGPHSSTALGSHALGGMARDRYRLYHRQLGPSVASRACPVILDLCTPSTLCESVLFSSLVVFQRVFISPLSTPHPPYESFPKLSTLKLRGPCSFTCSRNGSATVLPF
ncbi:hypothetical protein VTG60DRAFT_832 [Thermothelomyces hinnuleus]